MIWVVVAIGLMGIVFIHELGHFGVALLVGMRPRSFYIGFPPALVKIKRRGVEYGLGMIPLGGYVRIPGMHRPAARDLQVMLGPAIEEQPSLAPNALRVRRALAAEDYDGARVACLELEDAVAAANLSRSARRSAERGLRDVDDGTAADAYWRAPTWKRVAVIAAGPLANVVAAFVILFTVFVSGGAPTDQASLTVAEVQSGLPAEHAGLRENDRIVAVNGTSVRTFTAMSHLLRSSRGEPVTMTVIRDGTRVALGPERTVHRDHAWIWGFRPAVRLTAYPPGTAASTAAADLGHIVTGTGTGIASLFNSDSRSHLSGTVGIVRAGGAELRHGVTWFFGFLALVSMSLALLNLLPLLPLDGGHILFSLIESVRRRSLAREVYERVSIVGLALILLVFVIALRNDTHGIFG